MARAGRTTRSSSREISTEPLPRRTRAQSRQASVEGEGQTENRPGRNTRQNPQLETLPEDESEVESEVESDGSPRVDEDVGLALQQPVLSPSPSQPTHSQTELEKLDPDEMVEQLSDLNHQATQLLGQYKLSSADPETRMSILREVESASSKTRGRIDRRWDDLRPTVNSFGTMSVLDRDIVLRSLFELDSTEQLPNEPWRPDDLIYKANMAKFVYQFTTGRLTHPEMSNWFESWTQSFPACFTLRFNSSRDGLAVGQSALVKQTLAFALDLRTQFAITALLQEPLSPETVDGTIRSFILCQNSNEDLVESLAFPENAQGWPLLPPPQDVEIGGLTFAEHIIRRAKDMRDFLFYTDEGSIDLEAGLQKVQEQYPWERFQQHLLHWAKLRVAEIDQSIHNLGGIDVIRTSLEAERLRRTKIPNLPEEADDISSPLFVSDNVTPAPTNASSKVEARPKSLFRALKSLQSSTPRQPLASSAVPDKHGVRIADNPAPLHDGSIEPTTEQAQSVFPARQAQVAGPNAARPKKSVYDSQPDGVRIQFDDDQQTQPLASRQGRGFRLPAHQQPRPVLPSVEMSNQGSDVDDPSEDEGFQQDTRNLPAPKRRLRSPLAQGPLADPVDDLSPFSEPRRSATATGVLPSPKRRRKNPGQAIEPYVPSGKPLADLAAQAAHAAKIKKLEIREPARTRSDWTSEETQRLMEYIQEHGTSWATLKLLDTSTDNVLHDRTAEDMRLKARNLKKILLSTRTPLPPNFDRVRMGRKEEDAVAKAGVHYEQGRVRRVRDDISD